MAAPFLPMQDGKLNHFKKAHVGVDSNPDRNVARRRPDGGEITACSLRGVAAAGGLAPSQGETEVSVSTVERSWTFARSWLFREIQKCQNPAS